MKQNNPINGLRIVHNSQRIENSRQDTQIGNQNIIPRQNVHVIRILGNNNENNRLDGRRPDNVDDAEINIDAD